MSHPGYIFCWTKDPQIVVEHVEATFGDAIYAHLIEKQGRRGFTVTVPAARLIAEAFPSRGEAWEVAMWVIEPHSTKTNDMSALSTLRAIDVPPSGFVTVLPTPGDVALISEERGEVEKVEAAKNVIEALVSHVSEVMALSLDVPSVR